jgi:hypothetical protein
LVADVGESYGTGDRSEVLPHEDPSSRAIATTNLIGQDSATLLERDVECSGKARETEVVGSFDWELTTEIKPIEAGRIPDSIRPRADYSQAQTQWQLRGRMPGVQTRRRTHAVLSTVPALRTVLTPSLPGSVALARLGAITTVETNMRLANKTQDFRIFILRADGLWLHTLSGRPLIWIIAGKARRLRRKIS